MVYGDRYIVKGGGKKVENRKSVGAKPPRNCAGPIVMARPDPRQDCERRALAAVVVRVNGAVRVAAINGNTALGTRHGGGGALTGGEGVGWVIFFFFFFFFLWFFFLWFFFF
jgi:hypothetical protein